jgi:hypothetical protein
LNSSVGSNVIWFDLVILPSDKALPYM